VSLDPVAVRVSADCQQYSRRCTFYLAGTFFSLIGDCPLTGESVGTCLSHPIGKRRRRPALPSQAAAVEPRAPAAVFSFVGEVKSPERACNAPPGLGAGVPPPSGPSHDTVEFLRNVPCRPFNFYSGQIPNSSEYRSIRAPRSNCESGSPSSFDWFSHMPITASRLLCLNLPTIPACWWK